MFKESSYNLLEQTLFSGIEQEALSNILSLYPLSYKTYERGQIIINQGDFLRDIKCIVEGDILCIKLHYSGDTNLLKLLGRGDFIGLEAVSSTFHTIPYMAEANNFCILASFPYESFLASDQLDDRTKLFVLKNAIRILSDDNIRSMYKIDVLSQRMLRDRILAYLSIICEKRSKREINLGMTQEQFSDYLCVNRTVLTKELNQMRKEGIIDYKGKKYILL